jgi:MinD-like ATPase involved in chromosome partitioning or flagellar assembly
VIIALGSIRGAPGVTSWAVLLAAAWPSAHDVTRVVVEADPAGGVLGARFQIGVEPGLPQFLAGLRRSENPTPDIARCARLVSDQVWVIPAPETGERTRAVLGSVTDDTARQLATDQRVWFIDAGRLDETNPSLALVGQASTHSARCRRPNRGPRTGPFVRRTAPEAM